ncbi:MAG: carotenoid biosynthesis protein [Patescibacteria group bacterium]
MKKTKIKKWNFIYVLFLIILTLFLPLLVSIDVSSIWLIALGTFLMFIFVLWHALLKFGVKNSMIFLGLSLIISFLAEYFGVNCGYMFGGGYHYADYLMPKLLGVPVLVIIMWLAIIYICYQLAEHITDFSFKKQTPLGRKFIVSAAASLLTALAAVAWDLTMDPLAVSAGWWTWAADHAGSRLLGVPVGNFMGWVIVSFAIVLIYKLFIETETKEKESRFEFAPAIAYGLLWLDTFVWAIQYDRSDLAILSAMVMWPLLLITVIKYLVNKFNLPKQYKR